MDLTEGQKKYHKYLQSEEWQLLRQLAILRNKNVYDGSTTCVDCGLTHKNIYDVHHEQYPKSGDYWNDDSSDFHVVLCRECHEIRHKKNGDDMMYIKNIKNHSYLALYASYMACYQDSYSEIMELLRQIDLHEYRELFEFIKNKTISTIISTIPKSKIDKVVISEFIDSIGILLLTVNSLNDLEILKKDKEEEFEKTKDSMSLMILKGDIKKINRDIYNINDKVKSTLNEIRGSIKKKIRRKKRNERK